MGFPAYGREIVFLVKKGKNLYNYYSLGFEWILKSNPCRDHLSVHRNRTPEELSGTTAVLSWTLRPAHLAEPPNGNRRGATFSQGWGCQKRPQALPQLDSSGPGVIITTILAFAYNSFHFQTTFIFITSLKMYHYPINMTKKVLLLPFYIWADWESEGLTDLRKVMGRVSDKA